jgi:hypothetical protein
MLVKKGKGDKVAERGLSMVNLSSYLFCQQSYSERFAKSVHL